MPKYYDDMGNDVSHKINSLMEQEKIIDAYREEILVLKAEIKRLKTIPAIKKKKEIE